MMEEEQTRTLLCGDLFTQGGADNQRSLPSRTSSGPARRSVTGSIFSHTTNATPRDVGET